MPDLLFEIGTEEIPAGYVGPALRQLAAELERLLKESRLPPSSVRTAGTPRRLTAAAAGVPDAQPSLQGRTVGPPASVAFDPEGNPTEAAEGFARSRNVPVESLTVVETEKGPYLAAVTEEAGRPALEVLPGVMEKAVRAISFPKAMRWSSSRFEFARPVRWILALFGEHVVHVEINGVKAGRATRGHSFLAPDASALRGASFDDYAQALRERYVIVETSERREEIRRQIEEKLGQQGAASIDEDLLDEVTNLVEWPHAVECSFDERFLSLPVPILVAAMKEHQRYFPVRDAAGNLLARFITVSNRTAHQETTVREGNERKTPLDERVSLLKDVVFLANLGNNLERTERLERLATGIAERMGLSAGQIEHVRRAAHLCKADLLTDLVGEFPSLQGVVGRELAREQGEPEAVACAIAEHYLPAGASDRPPASDVGAALALADKLDVIVGCFSLGLLPTGSQDPYALRRNAQGVLQIVETKELTLSQNELLDLSRDAYAGSNVECPDEAIEGVRDFLRDRLYHMALDRGYRHDFVRAVQAAGFDDVRNFWLRLEALVKCTGHAWWPGLVEVVDRTFRIQRDLEESPVLRDELLHEPEEKELVALLRDNQQELEACFDAERYEDAAEAYCALFAGPVHEFFDKVFVNVEDAAVRTNRKSLCGIIYHLFADNFADLYLIESADRQGD